MPADGSSSAGATNMAPAARHVTTLIYAGSGGRLVLLARRKDPNRGLWSPPGGKIEASETPLQNARRELEEETGLALEAVRLRAVVTEHDRRTGEAWLMFVFVAEADPSAALRGGAEGEPSWVEVARFDELATPAADRHILDAVQHESPGVAFLRVRLADGVLEGVDVDWG
jgi:8-oxo-dGTP diphosphatase